MRRTTGSKCPNSSALVSEHAHLLLFADIHSFYMELARHSVMMPLPKCGANIRRL